MRHRKNGTILSRTSDHRKMMFKNMSKSIIEYEIIKTTLIKAKELRKVIEPMITLSKINNLNNRRLAFSKLGSKKAVGKLFILGERYKSRPGGYIRILKCGFRKGDCAPMALVEFVNRQSASS